MLTVLQELCKEEQYFLSSSGRIKKMWSWQPKKHRQQIATLDGYTGRRAECQGGCSWISSILRLVVNLYILLLYVFDM